MITTEEKDFISLQFKKEYLKLQRSKLVFAKGLGRKFYNIWVRDRKSRRVFESSHAMKCLAVAVISFDRHVHGRPLMQLVSGSKK